jgi:hypothetical protein
VIARAWHFWRELNRAETLSPKALLLGAARFAVLFLALHALGLREHTAVLSGTVTGASAPVSGFLGLMYLLSWFVAVLGVPPFLFAAGLAAIAQGLWRRARPR